MTKCVSYVSDEAIEKDAQSLLAEYAHPTMPQFRFEPDQIANLIAFLKSLE
jgi:hypothetical protein